VMGESSSILYQYSNLLDVLPEELHNRMITYALDNDHYAKAYLSRVSKAA